MSGRRREWERHGKMTLFLAAVLRLGEILQAAHDGENHEDKNADVSSEGATNTSFRSGTKVTNREEKAANYNDPGRYHGRNGVSQHGNRHEQRALIDLLEEVALDAQRVGKLVPGAIAELSAKVAIAVIRVTADGRSIHAELILALLIKLLHELLVEGLEASSTDDGNGATVHHEIQADGQHSDAEADDQIGALVCRCHLFIFFSK